VAAVDDRHQIIVEAQAYGTGSEQELLLPVAQVRPFTAAECLVDGRPRAAGIGSN